MAPTEVAECFRMVTDRAAATLGLGDGYGIETGRPASFILLPATDPFDVIRRQVRPSHVVSRGSLIATTPAAPTTLTWPGRDAEEVDFQRRRDVVL
jgi:cytosine deaminase